jgi:hypothetical protein
MGTIKKLFYNFEECVETLVDLEILKEFINCEKCGRVSNLTRYSGSGIVKSVYRCTSYRCSTH